MSTDFKILKFVQELVLGTPGINKAYLTRPSAHFLNSGMVCGIFEIKGQRVGRESQQGWSTTSDRTINIAVDLCTDDIFNDPTNDTAVSKLYDVEEELKRSLFGDPLVKAQQLCDYLPVDANIDVSGYEPGVTVEPYEITNDRGEGLLIAHRNILSITYVEIWNSQSKDIYINKHKGKIVEDSVERGLDFETA